MFCNNGCNGGFFGVGIGSMPRNLSFANGRRYGCGNGCGCNNDCGCNGGCNNDDNFGCGCNGGCGDNEPEFAYERGCGC